MNNPTFIFIKFPEFHQPKFVKITGKSLITGMVKEMGTIKHLGGVNQTNNFTIIVQAKTVIEDVHLRAVGIDVSLVMRKLFS